MEQEAKKQCSKCREWLPLSGFHMNKKRKDRLNNWCKRCKCDYVRGYRTPINTRASNLHHKYGITVAQYNRMFAEQNGVCAICKMPETSIHKQTGMPQSLAVDHDHKNGDVRALLCNNCNNALGRMNEDPERIRALLAYAEWCQTREPDRKIIQLPMFGASLASAEPLQIHSSGKTDSRTKE